LEAGRGVFRALLEGPLPDCEELARTAIAKYIEFTMKRLREPIEKATGDR